jgi:hypothetical protein
MQNDTENRPVRSQLLVLLCFLTFINSISGLWTHAERLWNPVIVSEQTIEVFNVARDQIESRVQAKDQEITENFLDSIVASINPSTIRNSAIVMLLFHSITLFGAYLMWNLQKRGYQIYLGGILVLILGSLMLEVGGMGMITLLPSVFFSGIFALIYRSQRKYWIY